MYKIYETSPRRSPRHVRQMDVNSNILKPKNKSPIRKGNGVGVGVKPLQSARALSSVTGDKSKKIVRKKVVNDENKENCEGPRITRTTGVGVNGSTTNTTNVKTTKPVKKVTRDGRLPLKELPLNGFLERL